VLGVAIFQRVFLHHSLPLTIWPAAAVMLGGAAMVIVPTIGQGAAAGLNSGRGWLGFGLSVASMVFTVIYFVSLQAFRHLGFTSCSCRRERNSCGGRLKQAAGDSCASSLP
jgi:hypothetical protein